MPKPCEPFAFSHCFGPYLIPIRVTLPPGYQDRLVPEGDVLIKRSEVEHTLNQGFDTHPTVLRIHRDGGSSDVGCGTTRVYRPDPGDGSLPPLDNWLVEAYIHAEAWPVGYRDRGLELARAWVASLTTIPLPGGAGDLTIETPPAAAATADVDPARVVNW